MKDTVLLNFEIIEAAQAARQYERHALETALKPFDQKLVDKLLNAMRLTDFENVIKANPALTRAYQRARQLKKISADNAREIAQLIGLKLEQIVLDNPLKTHFHGIVPSHDVAWCEGYWESYHMAMSKRQPLISRSLLQIKTIDDGFMDCIITDQHPFFTYDGFGFMKSEFLYLLLQEKIGARKPPKDLPFYCIHPPRSEKPDWMFGLTVGLSGGVEDDMMHNPSAARVAFYKLGSSIDEIRERCSEDLGTLSRIDYEDRLRSTICGYISADSTDWTERERQKLALHLPNAIANVVRPEDLPAVLLQQYWPR